MAAPIADCFCVVVDVARSSTVAIDVVVVAAGVYDSDAAGGRDVAADADAGMLLLRCWGCCC